MKLPLLEDRTPVLEIEEEVPEEEPEEKDVKGKKEKKGKGKSSVTQKKDKKSKSKSKSKSSKGSKKSKAPSPYDAEDEYQAEKRIRNTSFKTEGVPWSKVIQFPKDAVIVYPPENDLVALRDTFRSRVDIKVVYLNVRYFR